MIRNVLIAVVVLAVVIGIIRAKGRSAEEEKMRREDEAYRKSAEIARQRNEALERERQAQFVTSMNCSTAKRNQEVLKGAAARGDMVVSFGDGKSRSLSAAEIPGTLAETERYLEQNCKGR